MCSINGCSFSDKSLVERMNARTRHRGPDDTGVYVDDHVTLGNNRLAIIDVSDAGHQPMTTEDGRYTIAFNGEIYNFKELRAELTQYHFKSDSDTEVILAGFAEWGTHIFEKLNGIFAIALWDTQKRQLLLARDRFGVKPLYYSALGNDILFSSEVKALFEDTRVPKQLHVESLPLYLRLGYMPGTQTLFSGVRKLKSGHVLSWKDGVHSLSSFTHASSNSEFDAADSVVDLVRNTVDTAVRRQLVSDRPVGLFLSGGFDSSIILDSMSRVQQSVDTYSVGFEVPNASESAKFNADFNLARKTAGHYGARHHEYILGLRDLSTVLEGVVYHLDEPVGNATAIAQLALSRFAKESVTVALTGDGGDELFGGYPRYLASRRMDAYQTYVPAAIRSILSLHGALRKLDTPSGPERYKLFHFVKDEIISRIAPSLDADSPSAKVSEALKDFGATDWADQFMRLDRAWWLTEEALLRTDKMTMAAGLEARVPFLDNELVALADRVDSHEKVSLTGTKVVLKDAFRGRLPEYLYKEPKRGWFSPGAKWMRDKTFGAYVQETLSPSYTRATRDVFDWKVVQQMFEDHVERRRYNLPVLWNIAMLQMWARRFDVA